MIITISTYDDFYISQLLAFLNSVTTNSPKHSVHVYLVDYPKDIVEQLRLLYPKHVFEVRTVDRLDERGISFILMRIQLVLECFEKGKSVSWIDTDVIVRGDLSPFLEIGPKQLKILFRGNDLPEKVRFNAGIFSIGCSNETKVFVGRWYDRLLDNAVWGMGQLELYKAYIEHKDSIELVEMPVSYNDLGCSIKKDDEFFMEDSLMWHCKKGHFNNPRFQKEFQYYLKNTNASRKRIFIDAGANNSCSARLFREKYDKAEEYYIYSFEVDPRFFNCFSGINKLDFINKAVWIEEGEELFYMSYDPSMSGGTLFEKKKSGMLDKEHPIKVPTFDFSKWVMDNFDKEDEIILKMDIEGAEYPVLEKMIEDGSFDYINELWIEWHWKKVRLPEERHNSLLDKIKIPIKKWAGLEEAKAIFGTEFFNRVCSGGK